MADRHRLWDKHATRRKSTFLQLQSFTKQCDHGVTESKFALETFFRVTTLTKEGRGCDRGKIKCFSASETREY